MTTLDTITDCHGRTISLAELERVAEGATGGARKPMGASDKACWLLPDCFPRDCWITVEGDDRIANAAHIAAFDKATSIALVHEVRRLREALRPFADARCGCDIHQSCAKCHAAALLQRGRES